MRSRFLWACTRCHREESGFEKVFSFFSFRVRYNWVHGLAELHSYSFFFTLMHPIVFVPCDSVGIPSSSRTKDELEDLHRNLVSGSQQNQERVWLDGHTRFENTTKRGSVHNNTMIARRLKYQGTANDMPPLPIALRKISTCRAPLCRYCA